MGEGGGGFLGRRANNELSRSPSRVTRACIPNRERTSSSYICSLMHSTLCCASVHLRETMCQSNQEVEDIVLYFHYLFGY